MVIITFKPTQPLTKVGPNSVRRGLKGGDSPLWRQPPFPLSPFGQKHLIVYKKWTVQR